ncbi:hypothetical protein [Streptomyces iconiensis]|uniref:Uncharacterized protein n=1 Tax=Streptomyces iconiensis TaxID=1384038 RepID=A0ABT7A6A3_9ACTN|nr:hypothetical protein [Streptomyces iconiensis]MDJ1136361.1 hypothetical protein [Streptomyces iconiensis]
MSDAAQPTAADVRAAAEAVKAALDRHLEAVERRAGESLAPAGASSGAGEGAAATDTAALDAAVYAAFDELAGAGETYDELLYELYDEVTPFEIPGSDSLPAYEGPEAPHALSVLIRRDYTISEPQRLLAQAERVTELDPDSADDHDGVDGPSAGSSVHAALGVLFGEYEPDEIATRHKEFGLEEGDSTLWVSAGDEPSEPGEWLSAPFEQADPQRVVCRFDVSSIFDDVDLLPAEQLDDDELEEEEADESEELADDEEAEDEDAEEEEDEEEEDETEDESDGERGTRVR